MRLTWAGDEPHDAAEAIAQVLGRRREPPLRERMGVPIAVGTHRQAESWFVLSIDVAVRIEADFEGAIQAEESPEIPVGGTAEVGARLDRLHRSHEGLRLRPRIRGQVLEIDLDAPRVVVGGNQRDRFREQERMRAILESCAGGVGRARLAHQATRVGHSVEPVVVEDHEFAVPQKLDVDLRAQHVLAAALLDGERRVLGIASAPEAAMDLELDDPAAMCQEGLRIRRGTQLQILSAQIGLASARTSPAELSSCART